jgi:hypothetical protein
MTIDLNPSVTCDHAGDRLTFSCDAEAHFIVVRDGAGMPRAAFGGLGPQPGAFDTPVDITLVQPEFYGEPLRMDGMPYLAVADYGNARVQILALDGTVVAALDDFESIGGPAQLTWRAPFLEVEGVEGARMRIHLGAALLSHDATPPRAATPGFGAPTRSSWNLC